ncbi:hypothetical protein WA026_022237 [Henosepilachna vigintioctopunctata]|uniref:Uncharacterized protein n=1 Tax=Henosepilachna vigintioctopunctata TaxID=420089 RepID=A0AAW1UIS8_9CUCU
MEAIHSYFEENPEECQFSIDELMNQIEGDYRPDSRTVKSRLLQKYGDDIIIATASRPTTFCFLNTGFTILTNSWYESESLLFEISAIMRPALTIEQNSFSQFVFDNADFNTNTLDGLSTFHAMRGIHCVTPKTAIAPDQVIPRLLRMPSAKVVRQNYWYRKSEKTTKMKTRKRRE